MDKTKKLNQFLVNNEELEMLEMQLREFNPLKVLKVESNEIRHSNILQWLLTPSELHGLGEMLLKKIIAEVLTSNDNVDLSFSLADLSLMSFSDIEIYREWTCSNSKKRIDLLIVSKQNKMVILVENKILSKESENQLKSYIEMVSANFKGCQILPIYLTLTGEESTEINEYGNLSYESIYCILKFTMELHEKNLNPRVVDFINYYLKSLEALTMQNTKVIELSKQIYKSHKEAIDLIIQYGVSSAFEPAMEKFKEENKDIIESNRNGRSFWFITNKMGKMPKIAIDWMSPFPVSFWFRKEEDKIGIILEVGTFEDKEQRVEFMKYVDEGGYFKIKGKALKVESRYSRIFSLYEKFAEWDSEEEVLSKMNDLLSNAKTIKAREHIEKIISEFKWHKK